MNTPNTSAESSLADSHGDFHTRLNAAAGSASYRKLGRLTDTHPETVRRYMQGQAPSATFLTNLCRVLNISGEWLLTGRGPMRCTDMRSHALSEADPSELMTAVANTLTDLCDRMDRLERFVQTMETRIRGISTGASMDHEKMKATKLEAKSGIIAQHLPPLESDHEQAPQSIESKPVKKSKRAATRQQADGQSLDSACTQPTSAQRIRDAIAKRPS
jgi:hypothetical protein